MCCVCFKKEGNLAGILVAHKDSVHTRSREFEDSRQTAQEETEAAKGMW